MTRVTRTYRRSGLLTIAVLVATVIVTAQQGSLQPQTTSQGRGSDASSLVARWQLERIEYSQDKTVTPSSPENYRVEFLDGGSLVAQLDCNRGRGSYTVSGSTLTIAPILATLMACERDSLAREFTKALQTATSFRRHNDTLMLSMPNDGGTIYLRIAP